MLVYMVVNRNAGIVHIGSLLVLLLLIGVIAIVVGNRNLRSDLLGKANLATPAPPPPYFGTLAKGAELPSEESCKAQVRKSQWEPRPENNDENFQTPKEGTYNPRFWTFLNSRLAENYRSRITGNFTGTTDEILQWGACKWGIDENILRARAVVETNWRQGSYGDWRTSATEVAKCQQVGIPTKRVFGQTGCYQSYSMFQIRGTVQKGTYSASKEVTAFGVDYSGAWHRACIDGAFSWLKGAGTYPGLERGQDYTIWGCVGAWYAGQWYNGPAQSYIAKVKKKLTKKEWLTWRSDATIAPLQSPPSKPDQ